MTYILATLKFPVCRRTSCQESNSDLRSTDKNDMNQHGLMFKELFLMNVKCAETKEASTRNS